MTRLALSFLLLLATLQQCRAQSQDFSRLFSFSGNNPLSNSTFVNCHQLNNQSGYLILAERLTTARNPIVTHIDSAFHELWTTAINLEQTPAPFDNVNFLDIGELLNGNYFILGVTANNPSPRYVIFLLDTGGQVIDHAVIYDAQNITSVGNYPQLHINADSTLLLAFSEYERFGYYRLDQQLNIVDHGFYQLGNNNWGRDCIVLPDTSLLITGGAALTDVAPGGAINWSKTYNLQGHFKCLYSAPGGSIYAGGSSYSSAGMFSKFDAAGNPLFTKYYAMSGAMPISAVWTIYPDGNNLMLYSDSIMFVVDTLGNVLGASGKQVVSYNFNFLKPADPGHFILTGLIYQDSLQNFAYSLMKFNDTTVSGCLHPRAMLTTSSALPPLNAFPSSQAGTPVRDTLFFIPVSLVMDFDLLQACPSNPLGLSETTTGQHGPEVYPNPASDLLTIHFPPPGPAKKTSARILDITGKTIAVIPAVRDNALDFSTADLPAGLYLLQLMENGEPMSAVRFCVAH